MFDYILEKREAAAPACNMRHHLDEVCIMEPRPSVGPD